MRITRILYFVLLLPLFFACEEEEQQFADIKQPETLSSQLMQENVFNNYFTASAAYDKQLQLGIVAGGSLPSYEQVSAMTANHGLAAEVHRLVGFVNADAAATAFVELALASDKYDDRIEELLTDYDEAEVLSAVQAVYATLSPKQTTADELIQILGQDYSVSFPRHTPCIYEFNDRWNTCQSDWRLCSYNTGPRSGGTMDRGDDDGISCTERRGNCEDGAITTYNNCS